MYPGYSKCMCIILNVSTVTGLLKLPYNPEYRNSYMAQLYNKIRGRDLVVVLATKASVLSFYSNQYANPQCFRRRYRHSAS